MKALKIIAGLILLAILGFFMIGWFSPTVTYTNAITINKPADVAWKVFTDTTHMDQWLVGLQGMETLEGEPMTPGSRYKLYFEMEGDLMEVTETVTEVDSARTFAFDLDGEVLTSEVTISFTELDSTTTKIAATTLAEGKGLIWKPIISLSGSMMQQQSQQSYDKLKDLIESYPDTTTGLK